MNVLELLELKNEFPEIPRVLKDGDLGDIYDKYGEDHPFIHWNLEFMHSNLRESSKNFAKLFPNVVSKTKFPEVYRGLVLKKRAKIYPEINELKKGGVFTIHHKLYSSWTIHKGVAEEYSTEDEFIGGYISLRLTAKSSKIKIFSNLYEIGDMCEEIIVYPGDHRFKVKNVSSEESYRGKEYKVVYADLL